MAHCSFINFVSVLCWTLAFCTFSNHLLFYLLFIIDDQPKAGVGGPLKQFTNTNKPHGQSKRKIIAFRDERITTARHTDALIMIDFFLPRFFVGDGLRSKSSTLSRTCVHEPIVLGGKRCDHQSKVFRHLFQHRSSYLSRTSRFAQRKWLVMGTRVRQFIIIQLFNLICVH